MQTAAVSGNQILNLEGLGLEGLRLEGLGGWDTVYLNRQVIKGPVAISVALPCGGRSNKMSILLGHLKRHLHPNE